MLYEIRSPVIDIVSSENLENRQLDDDNDDDGDNNDGSSIFVQLEYELPSDEDGLNLPNWNVCCGRTYSFGHTWKLSSCRTTAEIIRRTVSCSYIGAGLIDPKQHIKKKKKVITYLL